MKKNINLSKEPNPITYVQFWELHTFYVGNVKVGEDKHLPTALEELFSFLRKDFSSFSIDDHELPDGTSSLPRELRDLILILGL